MAKPKIGLMYYSVDTDRYQDGRIKRLRKNFGCNGLAVYDYLLCEIYRVEGCFLVWDESTAFDVADYLGLKENTVLEIVNYCASVGLFSTEVLRRESVLTSLSIQQRYTNICKAAKRPKIIIPERLRILPEESDIIPEKSTDYSGSLPQSKVKKSKRESTTVQYTTGQPPETSEGQGVGTPPDLLNSNLYRQPKIPTKKEVWEHFERSQASKEMAKKFFDKYTATGWFLQGSPITNWVPLANTFIENWRKNEGNNNAGPGNSGGLCL